ncbi:hypothetical protein FGG08_000266 [Glutinoglossum americanum]|uniref:Las1-domain-containing protein n=1 Tax=Glutinoglossum americanum TaxID=1670608 RepID=A0A9P8IGN4_9PEZI|nr:hypothetical protein FGG08_000266 [Glutinoglossum americanum]
MKGLAQYFVQVRAWSVRGTVPHLIDSTSLLTQAILSDTPDVSQQVVRLTYTAAFCRFVTGLTDRALKGAYHRTMYKVARHLGLPTALVELRHAATHQKLLSLPVLRKATQRSLEWLWDNYWVKIKDLEMGTDPDRSSEIEEHKDLVRRILRPYKQSRVMRAKHKMPFDGDETAKVSQRIQDACSGSISKISVLIEVLLEPRFIIPDGRTLEDRVPLDIGFSLWNDILMTLSISMTSTFLPALLGGLLNDLCERSTAFTGNSTHKDNACLWISHILSSEEWKETLSVENIDLESVLQKCFMDPTDWTLKIASQLLAKDKTLEEDYAEMALLSQIQNKTDFQLPEFLTVGQSSKEQMEGAETKLISHVWGEVEEYEAECLRLKMLFDQTPTYEYLEEEHLDAVSLMSEDAANNEEEETATIPSDFQGMDGIGQSERKYVGGWTPKPDGGAPGWRRYEGHWIPKPIGTV